MSNLQFFPADLFHSLEFDQILQTCAVFCYSEEAKNTILDIVPITDIKELREERKMVEELSRVIAQYQLPLAQFDPIDVELKMLNVQNYVLYEESLIRLRKICQIHKDLVHAFHKYGEMVYPHCYHFVGQDKLSSQISTLFDRIFFPNNEIRNDASPELAQIRLAIKNRSNDIYRVFKQLVQRYRADNVLAEMEQSVRNGRMVLCVGSEHKRKVKGNIHDQSESGKIVFIEPSEMVELNNEIVSLELDEKDEIIKIFSRLTEELRPYKDSLEFLYNLLLRLDILQSKASLGLKMKAVIPHEQEEGIKLEKAYHPLLLLKNQQKALPTIPFSLYLNEKNHILLISGPNAGGKSVLLKAVGLLQLMWQSGFMLPVGKDSACAMFAKILGDIGDHQSVDEGLSTYSAKLNYMQNFVQEASNSSFILIDEFGSGTDPKIGGAIAEAVMNELLQKKTYALINSHYGNLKVFAHKQAGIVNGAMLYDEKEYKPLYQLKVGKPGSSYALELAKKNNVPQTIINEAKRLIGDSTVSMEELLIDLEKQIHHLETEKNKFQNKTKQLDALVLNYKNLTEQLELKKLKFKLEAKQKEIQKITHENAELNRLVKEIREAQNIEKAKLLAEEKKQKVTEVQKEFVQIHNSINLNISKNKPDQIEPGDHVKIIKYNLNGKVASIQADQIVVESNNIQYTVDISEVVRLKGMVETNQQHKINLSDIPQAASFKPILDIRGIRVHEAVDLLEVFLDKALLANVKKVHVLHGKGNGVLRSTVQKNLKQYNFVKAMNHPEEQDGGQGVTIVEFK